MATKTVIEALRDALHEEMQRDERVLVMGEDVEEGGVFRVTEGFLADFGPGRIIDTPLAESLILGAAIGAALNGMRPVAEIQFADFIHPAMDQIISEAARIRYRSNGAFTCPMVIRAPCGGGIHGALYHSQNVEAFFAHVPGLKVVAPSTPYDCAGLLKAAIRDDDPVLFFEHKKTYRLIKGEVLEEDYVVPIGKAAIVRQGKDLSIFTYGLAVHQCLEAAESMAQEVSVEVVDLRTLAPLDKETILESVQRTGKALIVHEDNLTGGIGGEVAAIIAEEGFDYLDGPVLRLAMPDVPAVPYSPPLEEHCLLNPEKIVAAIRKLAGY
ncbi:MAG: alpha-ketoacid dehydrogenase subunit beta [Anaerolineae bacterium]|nr:alpha-ketoacid dehydrogenase subunit beta [Anaerolineae bacterium]